MSESAISRLCRLCSELPEQVAEAVLFVLDRDEFESGLSDEQQRFIYCMVRVFESSMVEDAEEAIPRIHAACALLTSGVPASDVWTSMHEKEGASLPVPVFGGAAGKLRPAEPDGDVAVKCGEILAKNPPKYAARLVEAIVNEVHPNIVERFIVALQADLPGTGLAGFGERLSFVLDRSCIETSVDEDAVANTYRRLLDADHLPELKPEAVTA